MAAATYMYVYLGAAAVYVVYLLICIYLRYQRDEDDESSTTRKTKKKSKQSDMLRTKLSAAQLKIQELERKLDLAASKIIDDVNETSKSKPKSKKSSTDNKNDDKPSKKVKKSKKSKSPLSEPEIVQPESENIACPTETTGIRNRKNKGGNNTADRTDEKSSMKTEIIAEVENPENLSDVAESDESIQVESSENGSGNESSASEGEASVKSEGSDDEDAASVSEAVSTDCDGEGETGAAGDGKVEKEDVSMMELKELLEQVSELRQLTETYKSSKPW